MYKDKDKANEAAKERMKRYRRNKKGVTTEGVTECKHTRAGWDDVTSAKFYLELCRTCQDPLPKLEKPRQYPGMCLGCVTEKYRVVKQGVPVGSTA